jgi:WD40 repeat protein
MEARVRSRSPHRATKSVTADATVAYIKTLDGVTVASININPGDTIAQLIEVLRDKLPEATFFCVKKEGKVLPAGSSAASVFAGNGIFTAIKERVLIAVTVSDESAFLWNAETGACLQTLIHPETAIHSAALSRDGTIVLTVADDENAKIWAVETGECLQTFRMEESYDGVTPGMFSPDAALVLTIPPDHGPDASTVELRSCRSGECVRSLHLAGHVVSAVFSSNGAVILTTSSHDNADMARVWNADDGECLQSFECRLSTEHGGTFAAFASKEGDKVVTIYENMAQLWNSRSREHLCNFIGHHSSIYVVMASGDGAKILTTSEDGTAKLWSAENGSCLHTYTHSDRRGYLGWATMSPDGRKILTTSEGTAKLWNAETGAHLMSFSPPVRGDLSCTINCDAFSQDGTRVVFIEVEEGSTDMEEVSTKIFCTESGQCVTAFTDGCGAASLAQVTLVQFTIVV